MKHCSDTDVCMQMEGLPPSSVDTIKRSWARSRAAGLARDTPPHFPPLSAYYHLIKHPEARHLIHTGRGALERLWSAFGGKDWTIYLVSTSGVILHALKERHAGAEVKPLEAGRRMHENDIGTTAPACSFAESKPMVLLGDQHYLESFGQMTCLSVPVHGEDGNVAAILGMTGKGQRPLGLMMEHFQLGAYQVETALFAHQMTGQIIRLDYQSGNRDTARAGFLAINDSGYVSGANRVARIMVGLPLQGKLAPVPLNQLLGARQERRVERLLKGQPNQRLQLLDGARVFASSVRSPGRKYAIGPKRIIPSDLKQSANELIKERLDDNGGNVSRTARELNISRNTLYKRLREGDG